MNSNYIYSNNTKKTILDLVSEHTNTNTNQNINNPINQTNKMNYDPFKVLVKTNNTSLPTSNNNLVDNSIKPINKPIIKPIINTIGMNWSSRSSQSPSLKPTKKNNNLYFLCDNVKNIDKNYLVNDLDYLVHSSKNSIEVLNSKIKIITIDQELKDINQIKTFKNSVLMKNLWIDIIKEELNYYWINEAGIYRLI